MVRSGDNVMPTEPELNRVIGSIRELLYSASDVSHDRCVKVLTARAKVRPQTGLQSEAVSAPSLGSSFRFWFYFPYCTVNL